MSYPPRSQLYQGLQNRPAVDINSVRSPLLCSSQLIKRYQKIGPEGVIERLMSRREHFLAVKICEYLELPPDNVYTNWACLKVHLLLFEAAVLTTRSVFRMRMRKLFVVLSWTSYACKMGLDLMRLPKRHLMREEWD